MTPRSERRESAAELAADFASQGMTPADAEQAAACWVHTTLVALWLEDRDLLPTRIRDGRDLPGQWVKGVEGLAAHPATAAFADPAVNPGVRATPTARAVESLAAELAASPDHGWTTWPVGDAYQTLSAQAVKERALVQTPRFVADLIVKCSVGRAMLDLGDNARDIRVIDPACGTGHMLVTALEAVRRMPHRGGYRGSGAVDSVRGVDLDAYAALVARWRLAAECLPYPRPKVWGDLDHDLPIHVAGGVDSLLGDHPLLDRGQYHAVVANPPYVTVKDKALNDAIRSRYREVCYGKYSLAVPFMPLLHQLALPGGWVGQLATNAWMKREYGRPLIEKYLPTIDLRWVIDTSGAYIPGHGTPTVIIISRNQPPVGDTVRAVLGKGGEPSVPADPAKGLVWTSIREAVERFEQGDRYQAMYEYALADAARGGDAQAAAVLAAATDAVPAQARTAASVPVQADFSELFAAASGAGP